MKHLLPALMALSGGLFVSAWCHGAQPAATQPSSASTEITSDVITRENRGAALMGKFDFDAAIGVFSQIVTEDPQSTTAAVNLAIATLNRQREGDSAAALAMLDGILRNHPQEIRARYCRGLLLLNAGKPADALAEFRAVADKDASDAYAAYWIGQSLAALDRPADALPMFLVAEKLKPTLRSAYYGAFQTLQKLSRIDEAKQQFTLFQDLKDSPQAVLIEFKYTRMGPKAEASVSETVLSTTMPAPPVGPAFAEGHALQLTDATGVVWNGRAESAHRPTITAADIDGDGRLDLFIAGTGLTIDGQPRNAVLLQRDHDTWELARTHPLAKVEQVNAALWGDFDNDGLTDVYLCRTGGNQLWRQTKAGEWQDVTSSTGAAGAGGDTIDGAFVDADHDGDLDLFLVRADGANLLLNNDGDGRFRDITAQAGVAGDGTGAIGLVANDLDHDGTVDFMVLKRTPPHEVYLNDLRWHFHRGGAEWSGLIAAPMDAAIAADADADGRMELYCANGPDGVNRWNLRDGAWTSTPLPHIGHAVKGPISVADVDGTGKLQLLFCEGGIEFVDVSPNPAGSRVHALTHPVIRSFAPVVLDAAHGPAIVGVAEDGSPFLWPAGPGRLDFAAISLSGRNRAADQMRSNASGVGVKLAVRINDHWTSLDTFRNQSGPGQSCQPISVGLRGAPAADFVRLTWPEALQQTEIAIRPGAHQIEETQRQTSSCPVIFAWDGHHFAFVTDCLGVGGIGFALGPHEFAPERPQENVLLSEGLLQPRDDGTYAIKLTEPMEEACYLDAGSLVSYDLPAGWSMTLDERMATGNPEPTSAPRFYRHMMLPSKALNDRGEEQTDAVRCVDQRAADPGPIDPRFIGHLAREHVLTLSFDQPIDSRAGQPMLIANGWIEYPYSQTMFAAWQAGAKYDAPTIEARSADGRWVPILEQFGYPAGMPREMSVPLPVEKLPAHTTAIRIRTTMEIYWDRLAIAWAEPCPQAQPHVYPLVSARTASTGFALRTTAAQRRPVYDYDRRTPLWDTRHQEGFYTQFGPATDLVREIDDAVCVFGPGEEVEMDFSADEKPIRQGWTRQFVLELAGWCKDRDLYTKDGKTIAPLPQRAPARLSPAHIDARQALHKRYNTRWISGSP